MKTFLLGILALFAATPAAVAAPFAGPRAEITAGTNDISSINDTNIVYGAAVGYDLVISEDTRIGLEVSSDDVFDHDRSIGASVRLGYVANPKFLVYGSVGYENYRLINSGKLDGLRLGSGFEYALTDQLYVKAEYRYTNLGDNARKHTALVGAGLRF